MKRKGTVVGVAAVAILAAIAALTVTTVSKASTFYYTVDEFRALSPQARQAYVQVNGNLQPGVQFDPKTLTLRFSLAGTAAGTKPLNVVVHGQPEPSPFNPGEAVVVGGRLAPNGTFVADRLMIKCPSKYTPATPGS